MVNVPAPDPDWAVAPVDTSPIDVGPAELWQRWWRARAVDGHRLGPELRCGFTLGVAELGRLGVTRPATRHAIATERWVAAARGVVGLVDIRLPPGDPYLITRRRHALVAAAAAGQHRDHVVSGRSAAVLDGLPTLRVPVRPELTDRSPGVLGRHGRAHLYGAGLRGDVVTTWWGVPTTTTARTLVDLARHNRRDAIMALDAALRENLVAPGELDRALAAATGWPGVRQARALLPLGDGLAESPLESLTRLALHDDGFPPAQPQVIIGPYRVDLVIEELGLVIECDGRGKYLDRRNGDPVWEEKKREHTVRILSGYRVERVISDDVLRWWPRTSRRLLGRG